MADATPTTCLNCGSAAPGRFCPDCGQRTDTCVPTLRVLGREAVEAFFSLDAKLWRTLRLLFLQPGALTAEYVAGRRAAYVPPLQLYLWLQALVLFLYATVVPNGNQGHRDRAFFVTGLFFAGLLRLMFGRRDRRGAVHFVAALHIVSFLLFLTLADSLYLRVALPRLGIVPSPTFVQCGLVVLATCLFVYTVLAVRRAYGESLGGAVAKTFGIVLLLGALNALLSR